MMDSPNADRGLLIALEGIDGSGTSTQADLLVRRLNQRRNPTGAAPQAHLTREPSSGVIGSVLRAVLAGEYQLTSAAIALLFAADRVDHYHSEIEPNLAQGVHVVSDRYVYSSLAYQTVYELTDWVFRINARAPSPDLAVYVRVSVETAATRRARRGGKNEIFDANAIQRQIAGRYDELLGASADESTWQIDPRGKWRRRGPLRTAFGRDAESAMIDGEQTIETVHQQLWTLLGAKLQHRGAAEER